MTTQTVDEVWIITGASRGLGRALAEVALESGDRVVAAARTLDAMASLVDVHGDRVACVRCEAGDAGEITGLVDAAVEHFGRLDVVVNNAGRAIVGAAEEITDRQLRELMDLHLFAPAALTRAALPVMRAQGKGAIVQMSSQGGRLSFPGVSAYSASKFALEGWSEALAAEVRSSGVDVMLVEPSRFRTGFNSPAVLTFTDDSPAYSPVLSDVRTDMAHADGRQEGDPRRAAEIIVGLVASGDLPLRLPLGAEAVTRLTDSYQRGLREVGRWADLARSADFTDHVAATRPF